VTRQRVIVIGSGIVGASAAYQLAASGAEAIVVDRGDEGQATAAGAGVIFPWPLPGEPPAWAALCAVAADHWPRALEALAADGIDDPGYRGVGGISITDDESAVSMMVEGLEQMKRSGAAGLGETRALRSGEARDLFPVLRSDLGGVWAGGIGRANGRVLRDAYLEAAVRRGATRRPGAVVLSTDAGGAVVADVDGEPVAADAVIAAAGAWTGELCRPLGVDVPVYPWRGQVVHLDVPGLEVEDPPIVQTMTGYYLLGFPGGRVVAGSTREEVGFDYRATAGGIVEILEQAFAVAPDLAGATVADVRVGFRPGSRDQLPFLGSVDGVPGLVVATGLGATGLTLGPVVGTIAADVALGRKPPLDLTPYRPNRST
jgi:D-amino-acid dehydrogenase